VNLNIEGEMMSNISIAELKIVSNLLLQHLEASGIESIEISEDFYWEVPHEFRYDKYDEPKQLNVGQLSDDVYELKRLINGEAPPMGLGLVWLSSILRRIGETSKV
jgi:hypothetical protein